MDFCRSHELGDNRAGDDDAVRDEAQPDILFTAADQLARLINPAALWRTLRYSGTQVERLTNKLGRWKVASGGPETKIWRAARLVSVGSSGVTDGTRVVTARAEDGNRLLAAASEENARTWQFSKHKSTSFTVTYRYRLDANADPNNATVTLRFPTEVDVSIAPLVLSDPPADIKK